MGRAPGGTAPWTGERPVRPPPPTEERAWRSAEQTLFRPGAGRQGLPPPRPGRAPSQVRTGPGLRSPQEAQSTCMSGPHGVGVKASRCLSCPLTPRRPRDGLVTDHTQRLESGNRSGAPAWPCVRARRAPTCDGRPLPSGGTPTPAAGQGGPTWTEDARTSQGPGRPASTPSCVHWKPPHGCAVTL